MIKTIQEGNNTIMFDTKTFKAVDIIMCEDYMLGKVKKFYRVDANGKTIDSLISRKSEAEKIGRKYLKGEI